MTEEHLDPAESWLIAHIEAQGRKHAVLKEMIVAWRPLRDDDRRWCVEQLHKLVTYDPTADAIEMPSVVPRPILPRPKDEDRPSIEDGMKELE